MKWQWKRLSEEGGGALEKDPLLKPEYLSAEHSILYSIVN